MKKKYYWIIGIIIIILVGGWFIFSYIIPTDGIGWSKRCQVSSDCAFVERVNVPVPGPEDCYSIIENLAIQKQNLISDRKKCECINNICIVKTDSLTTTVSNETCEDSDGGKDYYVKGSLDVGCPEGALCGVFVDYCKDANILLENFCINGEPSEELYTCPNGCVDGACLPVM